MDPTPPPATMEDLDAIELDEYRNNVTIRELEELGQHRASSYFRSLQQVDKMMAHDKKKNANDNSTDDADDARADHYFQEGDMVKLKHHSKEKFEFKWKGPYHVVRLGHPGTYWLMAPRGDILASSVNQRDLAPWLAVTKDNENYFYDGTTRDFSEDASNQFSEVQTLQVLSSKKPSSKKVSFALGSLEGDSVTFSRTNIK